MLVKIIEKENITKHFHFLEKSMYCIDIVFQCLKDHTLHS